MEFKRTVLSELEFFTIPQVAKRYGVDAKSVRLWRRQWSEIREYQLTVG